MFVSSLSLYNIIRFKVSFFYAKSRTCSFIVYKIFWRWTGNGSYDKFYLFIYAYCRDNDNLDFWNFSDNKHHWIWSKELNPKLSKEQLYENVWGNEDIFNAKILLMPIIRKQTGRRREARAGADASYFIAYPSSYGMYQTGWEQCQSQSYAVCDGVLDVRWTSV